MYFSFDHVQKKNIKTIFLKKIIDRQFIHFPHLLIDETSAIFIRFVGSTVARVIWQITPPPLVYCIFILDETSRWSRLD